MKLCLCIPLIHSLSSSRSVIFIYSVSVFPREVPSHLISHQHLAHCVRRVYLMSEHMDSSFSLLKTYPTFCQEEDSTCVLVSCLKVLIALIFIGCISVRLLLGPGCFLPSWPRWVASLPFPPIASYFWIVFSGHASSTLIPDFLPSTSFLLPNIALWFLFLWIIFRIYFETVNFCHFITSFTDNCFCECLHVCPPCPPTIPKIL